MDFLVSSHIVLRSSAPLIIGTDAMSLRRRQSGTRGLHFFRQIATSLRSSSVADRHISDISIMVRIPLRMDGGGVDVDHVEVDDSIIAGAGLIRLSRSRP